jgi:RNA polymerase sigma-70 factor (ECF subfamily)
MNGSDTTSELLLAQARSGNACAREELFSQQRERLKRMVAGRLDQRLAARVDASDIVQEALCDAAQKLDVYLRDRPLPFYPWLYQLARERVSQTHRRHFNSVRDPRLEQTLGTEPSPDSVALFVKELVDTAPTPSGHLARDEANERVREALKALAMKDREILMMRHLDGLSFADIAAILGQSQSAVKMRHLRALERLRQQLDETERPRQP